MTTLNKLHAVEVEILDEIVRICNKHSLTYFLVGGTLLGAVRHQGFIPWDDDLDIAMPRDDYNRFLELCKTELFPQYVLQYHINEPEYILPFAKIRKKNTVCIEQWQEDCSEVGIWVDIFPLDYSHGSDKKHEQIKTKVIQIIQGVIRVRKKTYKGDIPHKTQRLTTLANLLKISNTQILSLYTWISATGKKGDYIVNQGSQYGLIKQTISKDKYFPAAELMFCGKMYSVPHDYEGVLRSIYGDDYMQLPPVEKRVTHSPVRLSFDTSGPDEVLEEI